MDLLLVAHSWILSALLVMIPSMILCVLVLWAVRKTISTETLRKNHDVAGFTFSLIGVLYSVILGFTVINVENRYIKAEETLYKEAMILADLYREASFFPTDSTQIRENLRQYVEFTLEEEWRKAGNREIRLGAQDALDTLWNSYVAIHPQDEKMKLWYEQSISHLDDLMNARLMREFNSWEHVGPMMWTLLIVGAIITICFMFFFGLENIRTQMLMTALLSGYLSFMLYLVYSLDHIYQGSEGVKPFALEQVIKLFDRWDKI